MEVEPSGSVSAEPAPDPRYDQTILALRARGGSRARAWVLFLVTVVLFAWAADATSPTELAVLVGVILFHELGHFVAMKAFRYTDVRMFFIPFFGAAVSGEAAGAPAWKRAIVLLAGPAPGIVAAFVALRVGLAETPLVAHLVTMLLVLNLFNLLPLVPFDGGKLFELIAFGRRAAVEMAAAGLSALSLVALALYLRSWVLGVVGYFVLISLGARWRETTCARAFREEVPQPAARIEDAPEPELRALYRVCRGPGQPSDARLRVLPQVMRSVHARAVAPRPGLGVALGVLAVYAAVMALGLVPLAPGILAATASDELDREEKVEALAIRYPQSFKPTRQEWLFALERGNEGLVVLSRPLEGNGSAEVVLGVAAAMLMTSAPVAGGETSTQGRGRCAGLEGPTTRWRAEVEAVRVTVEACAAVHDRRVYVVVWIEPDGLESDRRVAERIAASAHF